MQLTPKFVERRCTPGAQKSAGGVSRIRLPHRFVSAALAICVTAPALAGCASAVGTVAPSVPRPLSRKADRHPSRLGASTTTIAAASALGTPLSLTGRSGGGLAVTLGRIIDPAQGIDPLSIPQVGYRFVGVVLTITGSGELVPNDINADTTVFGTDGKMYIYVGVPIANCNNFAFGPIQLQDGSPLEGCVTFELPDGVGVGYVEFAPTGEEFAGHALRWMAG